LDFAKIFLSLVTKFNNMQHIFYAAILFFSCTKTFSQIPFWTETFGTGCNQGNYASGFNAGMGTWSVVSTGNNDTYANKWFISATESGMGIGNCGDGCLGTGTTNRTLHIGWDINVIPLLDDGSIYSAGNGVSDSDIRAQSPTINCTGQNCISVSFAYLLQGVPGFDYFQVQYSANGGSTWSVIATPPPTLNGPCSPQGIWTGYTVALPASANNNNNVKVGFRWVNTDNTGADPSVAIDDVKLFVPFFGVTYTMSTPFCQGNSTTVTAVPASCAPVSGYTWTSAPPGPIFGTPNASVTSVSFPTAGNYSITITAASGGSTATNVQTVVINPTPVLTPSASANTICSGQNVTLTVSGGTSYTWMPVALNGSSIVVNPNVTTDYTVVASAVGGCTAAAFKSVTVNPTPNLTITPSSATICSGASSTMAASGAATYTWDPGALTGANVVVSPTVSTTYTVTGSSVAGCTATGMQNITVNAPVNLTLVASPATLCSGASSTLTGTGASSYTWNPGAITGSNAVVSPSASAAYTCTGFNGTCTGSNAITVTVAICSGINTLSNDQDSYRVYPNPVNDKLFVQVSGPGINDALIEIVDALGKIISKQNHYFNSVNNAFVLNVNTFPAGFYFVKIISAKETKVIRFIKE